MKRLPKDLVIVAAKRTPFGTYGGGLKSLSATELGVEASKAALEDGGVDPSDIDAVIFGNVMQTSKDAIYLARHIGLKVGAPIATPAMTHNRLCGSGFQAVVSAALEILTGQADTVLCGGSESMSQAPHVLYGARWGLRLGQAPMVDSLWESLYDPYADLPMSGTADKLAKEHNITREEADEYAALSQLRFAAAQESGALAGELAPVTISSRRGDTVVDTDEHPRPGSTVEKLAKLRSAFGKESIITAGNASGINDGAGAMVLTTAEKAKSRGWTPLARLLSWGVVGCDPTTMGIGPVGAMKKALAMADLGLEDMDIIDVNEAFAPQYLAVEKVMGLDREKTNVNGGAIAVGHPLAASGARITMQVAYELKRRGAQLGMGSACIGGGQGIAVLLEAV